MVHVRTLGRGASFQPCIFRLTGFKHLNRVGFVAAGEKCGSERIQNQMRSRKAPLFSQTAKNGPPGDAYGGRVTGDFCRLDRLSGRLNIDRRVACRLRRGST
jgi:hypothetical protein